MPSSTILIVEDEPKLASLIQDYLQQAGYACHWIAEGGPVLDWVHQHSPALVLLDVMLPGKDGLSLCRELRQFSQVPIIMTTARVEEIDRLLGLELGADDYLCKPYSLRELVARVRALLRRSQFSQAPEPAPAALQLDEDKYRASLRGQSLELTRIEFQLLRTLAREPGRLFTREQLMGRVYDDHRVVSDRTIDSHIKKLRRKLKQACPEQDAIQSLYGVGYRYEDA